MNTKKKENELLKEVQKSFSERDIEKAYTLVMELYHEYDYQNTPFAKMLQAFMKKEYVLAGNIANDILVHEQSQKGITYYYTLFIQMRILYEGFDGAPPSDILSSIKKNLIICMVWFDIHEIAYDEIKVFYHSLG